MLPMILLGGLIVGSALRIVASFPGPDPESERQRLAKRKQDEDTEVARQRRILEVPRMGVCCRFREDQTRAC